MAKLRTSVAQWGLVSGLRQDPSDLIVVVPPPSLFSPEARKGQLVVVVEAEGDVSRGRNACTLVAQTIREAYYSDGSASITSSLRKALKAANAALYQFNFEAPHHQRATVGVSCAVFHGDDLFIAQVPPAQAYVAHAGKLRGVPNPLSWTGGAQGGSAVGYSTALGASLDAEAEFFRSVLQPGDTVVLTSSNIARLLGKSQAEQLICFSDAASVSAGLYELCQRSHLTEAHAVVVEIVPELSVEARSAPLSPVGVSERGKLAAEHLGAWFLATSARARVAMQRKLTNGSPALVDEEQEDGQPAAPDLLPSKNDDDYESPFVPSSVPAQTTLQPAAEQPQTDHSQNGEGSLDLVPVGDPEPLPLSAFIGEGDYGGIVRPPAIKHEQRIDLGDNHSVPIDFAALPKKAVPPPPNIVERLTLPIWVSLVHVLGGVAAAPRRALRRRAPKDQPRSASVKARALASRRGRSLVPWLNVVLLAGVLGLLIVVGLQQNRRRDQDTIQKALGNVTRAVDAAEAAKTEPEAQQHLREAESALADLAPLKRSGLITETKTLAWGQYQDIMRRFEQAQASINRLSILDPLEVVATLPSAGGQARRIVLATDPATVTGLLEDRMYVLDRGNDGGTVYQRGAKALEPILAPGQTAGSAVVGKIRELLWREGEPLALDREDSQFNAFATAYVHGPNGWTATRLQGSELLALDDLPAASYAGNLYLWDNKNQQLMKYASGQFANLPTGWITQRGEAKLDQVADVKIDGDIYLLQTDGSIAVFRAGVFQRMLPVPRLAVPVQTITRFYVTPAVVDGRTGKTRTEGAIFLLDTFNERVIQISKTDGKVIQQMQARERRPLNRLMDLEVDAARGVIYLANGNQILRARLPQPPPVHTFTPTPTTVPKP